MKIVEGLIFNQDEKVFIYFCLYIDRKEIMQKYDINSLYFAVHVFYLYFLSHELHNKAIK